jgi:hypothetical protein
MRKSVMVVAAAIVLGVGGVAADQERSSPYVEIDGSKNPQDIPEWLAWETAFRMLALARRKGSVAVPASLGLAAAEAEMVFKEADGQVARDAACQKRVERLKSLGIDKVKEINAKTKTIQLDCRWGTLRARDRLLESLSPEGQTALTTWVNNARTGIRIRVPKAEWEQYRLPQ